MARRPARSRPTFPAVWLSVLSARAIVAAWSGSIRPARYALAVVLACALIPVAAIRSTFDDDPSNDVRAWLEEARVALSGAVDLGTLTLRVTCPEGVDPRPSEARLPRLFGLTGEGDGLRRIAGLDYATRFTLGEGGDRELLYCEAERPRLRLGASRTDSRRGGRAPDL
ncbi:MAG: hypothetical protein AB7S26_32145 [Sandaracinaceae bacterium]